MIIPFSFNFYTRAQEKSFELRMKRATDLAVSSILYDWGEELGQKNAALYLTRAATHLFVVGSDGYRVTEFDGEILAPHRGRREAHNLYVPYLSESQTPPKHAFGDTRSRQAVTPTPIPYQSVAGTRGLWQLELPEDRFTVLTIVRYPGAMTRRDEAD